MSEFALTCQDFPGMLSKTATQKLHKHFKTDAIFTVVPPYQHVLIYLLKTSTYEFFFMVENTFLKSWKLKLKRNKIYFSRFLILENCFNISLNLLWTWASLTLDRRAHKDTCPRLHPTHRTKGCSHWRSVKHKRASSKYHLKLKKKSIKRQQERIHLTDRNKRCKKVTAKSFQVFYGTKIRDCEILNAFRLTKKNKKSAFCTFL